MSFVLTVVRFYHILVKIVPKRIKKTVKRRGKVLITAPEKRITTNCTLKMRPLLLNGNPVTGIKSSMNRTYLYHAARKRERERGGEGGRGGREGGKNRR